MLVNDQGNKQAIPFDMMVCTGNEAHLQPIILHHIILVLCFVQHTYTQSKLYENSRDCSFTFAAFFGLRVFNYFELPLYYFPTISEKIYDISRK